MDNISVSWNKRYKFAKHFCMNNPFKKIFFCLVFWDLSAISSPIHTQISSLIVHPFVADINAHPDVYFSTKTAAILCNELSNCFFKDGDHIYNHSW